MFDGSFKTTAFINRLISGLQNNHHNLHVIGFNTKCKNRIKGVNYVDLGNEDNKINFIYVSLKLALASLFKPNGFSRILKVLIAIIKSDGSTLKRINVLNSIHGIDADILHIQWPSLLSFCEMILDKTSCKIILSQRGYHINVRPFVEKDNINFLKEWYPHIDAFHSVSKATREKSNLIFHSTNKLDKVIYSGIDYNTIPFFENYSKGGILKIISVGRPHWIKGYSFMIKVCEELKNRKINFQYTIIGAKANEELTYLVEEFGLSSHVKLTSKLPQQDVFTMIRESSLFVLPSIEEGLANVVIEAMTIGIPVITTNVGGMPEIVNHNTTGWLVPYNDVQSSVKQIEDFIKLDNKTVENIRVNARKKIEEQHNINNMILEFESLYYQCLD
jgi:colanic acid/amylovoran biosynthesis glycosyltransferase